MLARTLVLVLLPLLTALPAAAQAPAGQNMRGEVVKADAAGLTLKERGGDTLEIALPANVGVRMIVKRSLADIQKGNYIGVAGVPQPDGTIVAQSVHIFPEAMRGTAEGHTRWDLSPDSTMTNATVDAAVSAVKGQMLTLAYKGESKRILVTDETPIVTYEPGDRTAVKAGAKVILFATKGADGKLTATRIAVGKDVAPPM